MKQFQRVGRAKITRVSRVRLNSRNPELVKSLERIGTPRAANLNCWMEIGKLFVKREK